MDPRGGRKGSVDALAQILEIDLVKIVQECPGLSIHAAEQGP